MSKKCPGCGFFTLACQCKKDDNYCGCCNRVISDCSCEHTNHYRYPYVSKDDSDNEKDIRCNHSDSDHGNSCGNDDGGNSDGGNSDGGNSGGGNSGGGDDYSGGNNSGGDDD